MILCYRSSKKGTGGGEVALLANVCAAYALFLSSRGLAQAMSRALARGCEGPRGILGDTVCNQSRYMRVLMAGATKCITCRSS